MSSMVLFHTASVLCKTANGGYDCAKGFGSCGSALVCDMAFRLAAILYTNLYTNFIYQFGCYRSGTNIVVVLRHRERLCSLPVTPYALQSCVCRGQQFVTPTTVTGVRNCTLSLSPCDLGYWWYALSAPAPMQGTGD